MNPSVAVALAAVAGALVAVPAFRLGHGVVDETERGWGAPLVGAVLGAMFGAGFGVAIGWHWLLVPFVGLVGLLLALGVADLLTFLLPSRILISGGVAVVLASAAAVVLDGESERLGDGLVGALGYLAGMLILYSLARGALGFGDVRLAALLGWCTGLFGWEVTLGAVVAGSLVGAAVAVGALIRGADRKSSIPYGPPMMVGAWLAILLGG